MKRPVTKTHYRKIIPVMMATILIFCFDILTPLGVNEANLYLIPILLTIWIPGDRSTSIISIAAILLTFKGFYFSPEGIPMEIAIFNRFYVAIAIAVTWYILLKNKLKEKIVKQKNAALIKSASHFKLPTDSANVGVWSFTQQTQELEWSALHKRMWGYDEHHTDLSYEDWHSIILEEDKPLALKRVEDARINHTPYEVEYRIKRPNDKVIRWMKSFGQYYYNDAGEAVTLTGISIDISEQKSFTEELERKVSERAEELACGSKQLEETNKMLDLNSPALENANARLN